MPGLVLLAQGQPLLATLYSLGVVQEPEFLLASTFVLSQGKIEFSRDSYSGKGNGI